MPHTYADLHLHTVASDGTVTVSEQARRAKESALSCIAITDHDTLPDELKARSTEIHGVEVIAGVEIKADFDGVTGEILGYFVDPTNAELQTFLDGMEAARTSRMEEMIARCRETLGIDIELADVRAVADGNLGRPHLARVLVEWGQACDFPDAFDRLLGRGKPCYVPIEKAGFRDVIDIVHRAGGVTSLAHPCLMHVGPWPEFLDVLLDAGLDGLEVFYPYGAAGRGLTIEPRLIATMAEERGFLLTGGSDDHGPDSTKTSIGEMRIPYARVEAMKQALSVPL
ncbi:PHP domain-containing protein [Candidatus Bipolaricaulota bacterium]